MESKKVKRIFIAGNIAGGKTYLSHLLSKKYNLPVTHVDSVQFLPGMLVRPLDETRKILGDVENNESWIIDGYGPLDMIEKRLEKADLIVFVDLPLWRHVLWLIKRQIGNFVKSRAELPEGCHELTWKQNKKLFSTLFGMHKQMRPQMLRILSKPHLQGKVRFIHTKADLKNSEFFAN